VVGAPFARTVKKSPQQEMNNDLIVGPNHSGYLQNIQAKTYGSTTFLGKRFAQNGIREVILSI
jgi:hypothetical protein